MGPNQTLSEIICDMRDRGFITTFSIQNHSIFCSELSQEVNPDEVTVLERHTISDVDKHPNTHEVYGVVTKDNTKGIMLDTYAAYDEKEFSDFFSHFNLGSVPHQGIA